MPWPTLTMDPFPSYVPPIKCIPQETVLADDPMGIFGLDRTPCSPTLITVLSNPLLLHIISPYIPLPSLVALSATCRDLHQLLSTSPIPYRRLELSPLRRASPPPSRPASTEHLSQHMSQATIESDFYAAPLRTVFAQMDHKHVLYNVSTMVLDGLAVTAELVREIISEDRFNVRVLSIREVKHMNERTLRQVLLYAVRPGRTKGALKLRALYVFGSRDPVEETSEDYGNGSRARRMRTPSPLPTTGRPGARSPLLEAKDRAKRKPIKSWYHPSGRLLPRRPDADWANVLQACEGLIHFDAVLCRGPCHDPSYASRAAGPTALAYVPPSIATIALGHGCSSCASCPESPAIFGAAPAHQLPLLAPPPLHASTVRAAQTPLGMLPRAGGRDAGYEGGWPPRMYARCEACLKQRWCERCGKWWCEDCYDPARGGGDMHAGAGGGGEMYPGINGDAHPGGHGDHHQHAPQGTGGGDGHDSSGEEGLDEINWAALALYGDFEDDVRARLRRVGRQHPQPMGSKRECFGCGQTCHSCTKQFIRPCRTCRNDYCIVDNDGSSATDCDWCRYSGRRTLDPY